MDYQKGKKPIVQSLKLSLPVSHYVKIGEKSDKRTPSGFRMPTKLDHFRVTTTEREIITYQGKKEPGNFIRDESVHKHLGEQPTEIPIRFLYNKPELNFPNRLCCYFGNKLHCSGDGEYAHQKQKDGSVKIVECPCFRNDSLFNGDKNDGKGVCKLHGTLFFLLNIPDYPVGGMARFSTSSFNAHKILASMLLIDSETHGNLTGIDFHLQLISAHNTVAKTGMTVKIYYPMLTYKHGLKLLKDTAYQVRLENAKYQVQINAVEERALKALDFDKTLIDEADEITEEFRPEEHIENIDVIPEEPPPIPETRMKETTTKKKVGRNKKPSPEKTAADKKAKPIPAIVEVEKLGHAEKKELLKDIEKDEGKKKQAEEKKVAQPEEKTEDFTLDLEGLDF